MRAALWRAYLLGGVVATGAYLLLPAGLSRAILLPALCFAAVVAVGLGIRRHRPTNPGPWKVFLAGAVVYALAFVVWYPYPLLAGIELPFPSVADVGFLLSYVLFGTALVLVIRGRNHGTSRADLIDASIIALGLAVLYWELVVEPVFGASGLSRLAKAISVAYPLADLLLLALGLRLLLSGGERNSSFWLLLMWAGSQLVTDVWFAQASLNGSFSFGHPMVAGWMLSMVFLGTAGLHPSMAAVTAEGREAGHRLRRRVPVLVGAALIPPAVILVQSGRGEQLNLPLLCTVWSVIVILGFLRVSDLMVDVQLYQQAQSQLARLAAIVESSDDAILSWTLDGTITSWNEGAERLYGYSSEEMLGRSYTVLIPPDRVPESEQLLERIRRGERLQPFDSERLHRDGHPVEVALTISPITDAEGNVVGGATIARDISERRALERMKGEFTAMVSHELRTPLTSIRGSLGLLEAGMLGALPEKAQRMVEIAVSNTDRLVRLINDILDLEKIESGQMVMHKQACSPHELVTQAAEVMRAMANEAGVQLVAEGTGRVVWADSDRIIQTLTNLMSNAVKFSPSGTTVTVSAEEDGDRVLFTVADQGRGIPPEKLESVFGRFQQVEATDSSQKGGTGLGLAICRTVVQQHGGRIWVESALGEGSTFRFTLPALKDEEPPPEVDPEAPLVLACDDDPEVLEVLSTMLAASGYRVLEATTAEAALELATAHRPALILLDLIMPEVDGWELAAMLKEHPGTSDIPVVILSVMSRSEAHAVAGNVVGWLTKPLDAASLFRTLEEALAEEPLTFRVLVVEDDPEVARMFTDRIRGAGVQVFHAVTAQDAIALQEEVAPNLVMMDLRLPDAEGVAVVEWMRRHDCLGRAPLLVYTVSEGQARGSDDLELGSTELITEVGVPEDCQQQVTDLIDTITSPNGGREQT